MYLFFFLVERDSDFFDDFESLSLSPDFALLDLAPAEIPVPEDGEADPGEEDPEPVAPSCFFKNPKRELDFGFAAGSSSLMRFLHSKVKCPPRWFHNKPDAVLVTDPPLFLFIRLTIECPWIVQLT